MRRLARLPGAFATYFRRARELPPQVVLRKAGEVVRRRFVRSEERRRDLGQATYCAHPPVGELLRYFEDSGPTTSPGEATILRGLTDHYLAHRFDLLGSGWAQVKHGMSCRGMDGIRFSSGPGVQADRGGLWLSPRLNSPNLQEAQKIWRLVDVEYMPIDWQLDLKSGYRWSERTWYCDIVLAPRHGVDIKVPWELARMQHLPRLARAYSLAKAGHRELLPAITYAREFRNEVLDFIVTNPPRYGVNWASTMDVGIRVANWLAAFDMFRAAGAQFDAEFETVFARCVYEHGCHVIANLEWSEEIRANHYLANVVGLLFVAAYLSRTKEVDAWLAFAVQELIAEVGYQFGKDGANFEASTSYHRLSAEMVVYSTALVLGLSTHKLAALQDFDVGTHRAIQRLAPGPLAFHPLDDTGVRTPFPLWYFERIEKMAEFSMHVTKQNGNAAQIGDNDSGRFIKLDYAYARRTVDEAKALYGNLNGYSELSNDDIYWDESHLDHSSLIAAVSGLFGREDLRAFSHGDVLEARTVAGLCRHLRLPSYMNDSDRAGTARRHGGSDSDWAELIAGLGDSSRWVKRQFVIPIEREKPWDALQLYAYPDFGLYIFRSRRVFLAVRCGTIGTDGFGGHAHHDQLAVELNIDGEDWLADPGSYVYTASPGRRNEYRSVRAHFAPWLNEHEPGRLDLGLFRLHSRTNGRCLYFGDKGFAGTHEGYGIPVCRVVHLEAKSVVIEDFVDRRRKIKGQETLQILSGPQRFIPFSPGYGVLLS